MSSESKYSSPQLHTCFYLIFHTGFLNSTEIRLLDQALGYNESYSYVIQVAVNNNFPCSLGTREFIKWLIGRQISLSKINISSNSEWGGGFLRDRDLSKIIEICPNMISCLLDSNIHLTDASIGLLLGSCYNLQELSMRYMARFNGSAFSMVTVMLPFLKILDLRGCLFLEDKFIVPFTKQIPNLSEIAFGDNQRITDTAIKALANNCNKLEVLHFERLIHVTDTSISLLVQQCPKLRSITFNAVYNVRQKLITIKVLDFCPLLQVFILRTLDESFEIDNDTVKHLVKVCPMIRQLHLYSEHILSRSLLTGTCIQVISNGLQMMESLRLDVNPSTSFEPLELLVKRCSNIKCVDIRRNGGGIGDRWFYHVVK